MPAVRVRKTLAALLLLLATGMVPELAWAVHGLHHHDDHGHEAELAEVLAHGHEHPEGTPEHEHSARQDPPKSAQAPAAALLEVRTGEVRGTSPGWQPARLAGPSPPLLHLLCTLLI